MKGELTDVAALQVELEKKHKEWRFDQVLLKSYANTIGELRARNRKLAVLLERAADRWAQLDLTHDGYQFLDEMRAAIEENDDGK